MKKLIWSPLAKEQIADIFYYYKKESGHKYIAPGFLFYVFYSLPIINPLHPR